MKIGIISDTHDKQLAIDTAFSIFRAAGVTMIIHCGDWARIDTVRYFAGKAARLGVPVRGVLGNNDRDVQSFMQVAAEKIAFKLVEGVLDFTVEDKKIAVYHGHHQPTLKKLLLTDFDLICLGHSHKPRYDRIGNKIIVNPGSTAFAIPRSKDWLATVVVYDSDLHEAEFEYFSPKTNV